MSWKDLKLKDNTPKIDKELASILKKYALHRALYERDRRDPTVDGVRYIDPNLKLAEAIEEIKQLFNPNNVRK